MREWCGNAQRLALIPKKTRDVKLYGLDTQIYFGGFTLVVDFTETKLNMTEVWK